MKKYILVLVIALFSISTMFSQTIIPGGGTGEGGEGFCKCCEDDYVDPLTGAPYLGQEDAYDECYASCTAGVDSCAVPIDSSLLFLLFAGGSLGVYFISKNNKKRQFEI